MKEEWRECIAEMRRAGYAVVVFHPEEMGTIPPCDLEYWMIDCANQNIEIVQSEAEL